MPRPPRCLTLYGHTWFHVAGAARYWTTRDVAGVELARIAPTPTGRWELRIYGADGTPRVLSRAHHSLGAAANRAARYLNTKGI